MYTWYSYAVFLILFFTARKNKIRTKNTTDLKRIYWLRFDIRAQGSAFPMLVDMIQNLPSRALAHSATEEYQQNVLWRANHCQPKFNPPPNPHQGWQSNSNLNMYKVVKMLLRLSRQKCFQNISFPAQYILAPRCVHVRTEAPTYPWYSMQAVRVRYSRPRFKDPHLQSTPRFEDDIFSKSKVPRRYSIIIGG